VKEFFLKSGTKVFLGVSLVLLLTCCLGGAGFLFLICGFSSSSSSSSLWEPSGDIAIVEVKGPIYESQKVNEKLEKFRKNQSVKAVVLRIDSPGGAVGPSQEIYSEVKKLAAQKKVVVSMGAVAASGGYYIAAPATKILANPGSITGSIGVLMEHVEIDELLKWARINAEILKAGAMKDAGSLLRKLSPEERSYLEGILKNMHGQFLKAVSEGRNLPMEEVVKLGDGRAYTGEQALDLKLVDKLGNLEDAIQEAAQLAGIKGEPKLIKPEKPKPAWVEALMGDEESQSLFLRKILQNLLTFKASYLMSL